MNKETNPFKKSISYFPKEYLLIVLFVLLSIQNIFAEENIQRLESKLLNLPDDTVKVNTLIKLGEQYCSVDNEKALMYLQEAYTISTSQRYTEGIGKSLLWQGRVYYYKDDYPLSIKYLDKAKNILETTNELDVLAFLYFAKGEICSIRGDYIHAMEMYKAAIKLTEKTGNLKFMSTYYSSMGMVLLNRKDPEKALDYFRETLSIKKVIDDQQGISNTLTCIGKSYEELGELDSSLLYYNQALKIRSNLKMDRSIASSEYNIGGILIKMGKYVQAEESLQIALDNFIMLEEKTGIIISNLRLAITRNYQGKTDAVRLAESALSMAKKIDNPSLISHGYKILSDISFYNKNFKKSYEYLIKHKTLQDSLFTADKERLLTEFEAKFQSERKDNEIRFLKDKSKIQQKNNILLITLITVLVGVIVLLIFLFRFKSTALNRQKKLIEQGNIIHIQESKIIEKENLILKEQLESKNRELASKALEMIRFNDTISIVIEKLEGFKSTINKNQEESIHIKNIIYELENQTKQNIWNEFDKIFKNIHSGFYDKLLEICPDLTATEIKTAALLKLNLTTKEIAAITFKSEGGIKTTRYRLRKKLKLSSDEKLAPFLMKI
jgi:tetratricopeptide (TPR) repeat protein